MKKYRKTILKISKYTENNEKIPISGPIKDFEPFPTKSKSTIKIKQETLKDKTK